MATKRKVVRSTHAQLRLLVDYMSANPVFALGKFSGPLASRKMEVEWAKLRDDLSEYGPPKTVDQWKHTWRDLKKKAREDGAKASMSHGALWNNVFVPEMSEMSNKILDIIGRESVLGLNVEGESQIDEFITLPESDFLASPNPNADSDDTGAPDAGAPDSPEPPNTPPEQRSRDRHRPTRVSKYATRALITAQKQQILHLKELVATQKMQNHLLRLKLKRRRLAATNTAFNNLRF